jgi:TrmH family RNA methyltransferase
MLVDDAAKDLVALGETERVAVLFGPEDKGLTNDDLDRCHRIVTIPTRSEHSSMNLAQAATVTCYELYRAGGRSLELKRPRHDAPPASREQLEQLFADAEMALESFEFFKSRNQKTIMRGIRELVHRGPTDEREVRLLRAMALEVQRYLERKGV